MIKPIPGYKFYSISDNGIVYYKGIEKSVSTNKLGYKKVCVYNKGLRVHRLVALTFLGNIDGKVVMHLDDNPSNNCVSNLRIGSHSDNMQDMHSKGRWKYGKVHEIDIGIVNVIKSGLSIKEIIEKYGVHRNTVLFWKKKIGINTNNKYDISFITNVINYDGNNTKTGKHFGIPDVTVMRWRRKYNKERGTFNIGYCAKYPRGVGRSREGRCYKNNLLSNRMITLNKNRRGMKKIYSNLSRKSRYI